MSDPEERPDLDAGLCADRWRDLDDPWGGMPFDPWDKAEEPGGSEFAEWMRDDHEPTCLDCGRCLCMPNEYDRLVRAALGFRIGFCTETMEYVTNESTAAEMGNAGEDGCFRWWWE